MNSSAEEIGVGTHRNLNAVSLKTAVLCANCDAVSD